MRRAIIIMLVAALAGCSHVRHGLGAFQKPAEKSATVGDSGQPGAMTPPNSLAENGDTDAAPTGKKAKKGKKAKPLDLPGGLGGDKAHRAYTGDAPPK